MYLTIIERADAPRVYTTETSPRFVDATGAVFLVAGGAFENPPKPHDGEITPDLLEGRDMFCAAGDWASVVGALGLVQA